MKAIAIFGISVACTLALASGCAAWRGAGPDYAPVADEVLFARIAELSGVTNVHIVFDNASFEVGAGYDGSVDAAPGTDAKKLLDSVLAILWQGRPDVDYSVHVDVPGQSAVVPDHLGLITQSDYISRYGPQPGSGRPPS